MVSGNTFIALGNDIFEMRGSCCEACPIDTSSGSSEMVYGNTSIALGNNVFERRGSCSEAYPIDIFFTSVVGGLASALLLISITWGIQEITS